MMFSARELDFDRDGAAWPFREASRFVEAAGLRWHVQVMGDGPVLLLLHGTGASTHSWRGLIPLLREHFRIVALDLPGHGFTQRPPQRLFTIPGMAEGVAAVLRALDVSPDLVAGHSAGAAVMIRLALDTSAKPKGLVSLNGALKPYGGSANKIISPLTKLLFLNPIMPRFFAWQAGHKAAVERLIKNTGSTIDADGVAQYSVLVSNPDHVAAALGMMGNWELASLARDFGRLAVPMLLVAGLNDKAIRSEDAFAVRDMTPGAKVEILRGLGHLAHEEAPEQVAALILAFAREVGVILPRATGEGDRA